VRRLIILLGAPGSGKGTQAKLLAQRLGLVHLSTGDILREEMRLGTTLGTQAKQYMDAGKLVPDGLILGMIRTVLSSDTTKPGYILDGFPRTLAQATGLAQLASENGIGIGSVISLEVSDEIIVRRLSGRSSCPTCGAIYNDDTNPSRTAQICDNDGSTLIRRSDDSASVVRDRLRIYHEQTKSLEEFYSRHGLLFLVDGSGAVEEVLSRVLNSIGN
jgi:adenylate kinase